eukprot:m51a1_g10983 hypothetical protein (548) ;mRNA; r:314789-316750
MPSFLLLLLSCLIGADGFGSSAVVSVETAARAVVAVQKSFCAVALPLALMGALLSELLDYAMILHASLALGVSCLLLFGIDQVLRELFCARKCRFVIAFAEFAALLCYAALATFAIALVDGLECALLVHGAGLFGDCLFVIADSLALFAETHRSKSVQLKSPASVEAASQLSDLVVRQREEISRVSARAADLARQLDTALQNHVPEAVPETATAERAAKRRRIADELLLTEESYSRSLDAVVNDLIAPLQAALVAPGVIGAVFCNIEAIAAFHRELLASLRARMSARADGTALGDVFLLKADAMACYGPFLRNYASSIVAVHYLRAALPVFLAAVRDFEARQSNNLTLQSFLVMPVQRLPRYLLLVKELLKCTPQHHADRALLQAAESALMAVAQRVNSGVDSCAVDIARRAVAIVQSIEGIGILGVELVSAARQCVREGTLARLQKKGARLGHGNLYYFLLTDVLVLCEKPVNPKTPSQPYIFLEAVPIGAVSQVVVSTRRERTVKLVGATRRKAWWTLVCDSDAECEQFAKYMGAAVAAKSSTSR